MVKTEHFTYNIFQPNPLGKNHLLLASLSGNSTLDILLGGTTLDR